MFHLTVAIARFFEFLLLDIARLAASVAAIALIGMVLGVAGAVALVRLGRKIARSRH